MKIFKANKEHVNQVLDLLEEVPIFGQKSVLVSLIGEESYYTSINTQNQLVSSLLEKETSTFFICEKDGQMVGYLIVLHGYSSPIKHVAQVFIGVRKAYRNQGIGKSLFYELEAWARSANIYRLELLVASSNEAAISLFKKSGFEIEGLKKNSLLVAGQFLDEYIMAKLMS